MLLVHGTSNISIEEVELHVDDDENDYFDKGKFMISQINKELSSIIFIDILKLWLSNCEFTPGP